MDGYYFRKATQEDASRIWDILSQGIQRRKAEGSTQWQDGYPNPDSVRQDIQKGVGFVLVQAGEETELQASGSLTDGEIAGYCAVLINDEPAYAAIEGQWLTDGDFIVYHRVGIGDSHLGRGLARQMMLAIEDYAHTQGIRSLRADTNFDNGPMLALFDKLGYTYCGEVYFRGSARRAYEKVLQTV